MNVALFGGTGFVGNYLSEALIAADMHPVLLVRPTSEHAVHNAEAFTIVRGDIADKDAVAETIQGADAVIYNIGILREFPKRGITYEALQFEGARRTMDVAAQAGVKRYLLMSANGAKADGTPYQRTKFKAEQYLTTTSLDWTVFRPSVLFGDPLGRMEFATQLLRGIINPPLPAPLFYRGLLPLDAGQFKLSPVHVTDVAQAFITTLRQPETVGQVLSLGGPDELSWRQILATIASAAGKQKLMIPAPAWGVAAAATLFDQFESFPITRDQIRMLLEGNTCGAGALQHLGIDPTAFNVKSLSYLVNPEKGSESWHQKAA